MGKIILGSDARTMGSVGGMIGLFAMARNNVKMGPMKELRRGKGATSIPALGAAA